MSAKNEPPIKGRTAASMRRWLWALALGSLLLSGAAGAAMTWAAWQHNPQQAYHSPEGIDIAGLLATFGSWFVVVFALCCVAFIAFAASWWALWRLFVSRRRGGAHDDAK